MTEVIKYPPQPDSECIETDTNHNSENCITKDIIYHHIKGAIFGTDADSSDPTSKPVLSPVIIKDPEKNFNYGFSEIEWVGIYFGIVLAAVILFTIIVRLSQEEGDGIPWQIRKVINESRFSQQQGGMFQAQGGMLQPQQGGVVLPLLLQSSR